MPKITSKFIVLGVAMLTPLSVLAISSTSYEIVPEAGFIAPSADGYDNTSGMLESTSYQLQGAVDPYSGNPTSTSYQTQLGGAFQYYCGDGFVDPGESCDGADLNSQTCSSQGFSGGTLTCSASCTLVTSACTSDGGGGGGSNTGGVTVGVGAPSIDLSVSGLVFTYQSSLLFFGGKPAQADVVTINGKSDAVTYSTSTTWQKHSVLNYGVNVYDLVAVDGSVESLKTTFSIYRRLIGDVTQDQRVNDYDLSALIHMWGQSDRSGDFNEDQVVDDYDFSMLVARWGVSI